MVLASAFGLLIVVLRHQGGHRLHQLAGEGGAVGGGREPHLAVHRERGELLLGPFGAGEQVADIADELRGQRQQPAGRQAVRRPGRIGRHGRQRRRGDHVGGRHGPEQALGHVPLAALLHQLDQLVPLQRPQVVVDLLPRQAGGGGEHGRRLGSVSWASSRARAGSSAASAAAGSAITATSIMRLVWHPTKFFVKTILIVGVSVMPGRLSVAWAIHRRCGGIRIHSERRLRAGGRVLAVTPRRGGGGAGREPPGCSALISATPARHGGSQQVAVADLGRQCRRPRPGRGPYHCGGRPVASASAGAARRGLRSAVSPCPGSSRVPAGTAGTGPGSR